MRDNLQRALKGVRDEKLVTLRAVAGPRTRNAQAATGRCATKGVRGKKLVTLRAVAGPRTRNAQAATGRCATAPIRRRVYSSCGCASSVSVRRCSTTRPSFITITSSAMKRTTARSWLMNT